MNTLRLLNAEQYAPQVRRAFEEMRERYAPGLDFDAEADQVLDALKAALPREVYAGVLAGMMRDAGLCRRKVPLGPPGKHH
ncbi:hypothetical protein [Deinococcus apachensis]|uniref:hypothetical protein n=1 Tax=Deinococcus apachensis TaxID=309886 RepID=UPI0003703154|nr:hypothetical protein [Deinococcus apachensis]